MKKPFNNHLSENLVVKNNIVINNNETEICMFCSKNFKWSNNLIYSAETITFSNDAVEGHELKQYLKTAQWNDDITFSQGLDKYIKFDNDVIFSVNGVILCRENNATVKVDCSQYGIINQNPRITMENDRIIIGITLNNIKNTYSVQKSKPYCIVTKIKPEKEEYYKKLHNEIWDQVVKQGHLFNIRNYSIFKYKNLYVSFFEYIGDDFEKDINKKNKLPIIKKWQKLCNECFEKTDIKPELIFFDRF